MRDRLIDAIRLAGQELHKIGTDTLYVEIVMDGVLGILILGASGADSAGRSTGSKPTPEQATGVSWPDNRGLLRQFWAHHITVAYNRVTAGGLNE